MKIFSRYGTKVGANPLRVSSWIRDMSATLTLALRSSRSTIRWLR